ncbi:MAG: hypothetical protein EXS37_02315 [Opitutus sp.]|nr:hypothetical protein [Opitutus sp.]
MLFFRRIFDFEKAKVAEQLEHRLNRRYALGAAFPLQATLTVEGRDWPAEVQNVSGGGVGLLVGSDAAVTDGQTARVRLVLADHLLEIDARLAHRKPHEKGIYCGIGLNFGDSSVQKAYLQLLQPIIIGQSLKPVPADRVIQNEPQFIKQVYRGESDSVLTVWLANTTGTPLHSFEFQMHDYFCRATLQFGVLEVYALETVDSPKAKMTNPIFDTTGGLEGEIRQLFRWIVPNLAQVVPDNIRVMLQGFASK